MKFLLQLKKNVLPVWQSKVSCRPSRTRSKICSFWSTLMLPFVSTSRHTYPSTGLHLPHLPAAPTTQEWCHSPCRSGWEENPSPRSTVAAASSCPHACVCLIRAHPVILTPLWLPQASVFGGRKEGSVKGCLSWSWSTSLEPPTIEGLFGQWQGQAQARASSEQRTKKHHRKGKESCCLLMAQFKTLFISFPLACKPVGVDIDGVCVCICVRLRVSEFTVHQRVTANHGGKRWLTKFSDCDEHAGFSKSTKPPQTHMYAHTDVHTPTETKTLTWTALIYLCT